MKAITGSLSPRGAEINGPASPSSSTRKLPPTAEVIYSNNSLVSEQGIVPSSNGNKEIRIKCG